MQKTPLSTILREEILRGLVFGSTFFIIVLMTLSGVAHAAAAPNTGLFGSILEKILGIPSGSLLSYAGDGTVKNASNLNNTPASDFQKVIPGQSCGVDQCIYGFDTSGNALCR